jgi:hypothetical protein
MVLICKLALAQKHDHQNSFSHFLLISTVKSDNRNISPCISNNVFSYGNDLVIEFNKINRTNLTETKPGLSLGGRLSSSFSYNLSSSLPQICRGASGGAP